MDANFQEWMEGFFKKYGKVIEDYDKRVSDNERQQLRQMVEEIKNEGKLAIEEVPNIETMEQLNLQTETNGKQTKYEQYVSTLLSENKHNRNKENIQHKEATIKSVKNQVIQKIKKIGKIFPKKIRNTREGMEMIIGGLINMFNLPINEQREIIKFKNSSKNLIKI